MSTEPFVTQPRPATPERDQQTLRDLSALAAAGDHDAFEAIHRRIGPGLRRLLLGRSGGREDLVDDLCQKTWASVWKALSEGKYDPERAAITTFAYAVANNAWLSHLRVFAREQGYVEGSPAILGGAHAEHAAAGDVPEEVIGEAELVERMRACLRPGGPGGLSDEERTVVRAIAAGESDRGLARRLGVSSSTVNVRKHSGYAKIRAYLEGRVTETEATGLVCELKRIVDGKVAGRVALAGVAGRLP